MNTTRQPELLPILQASLSTLPEAATCLEQAWSWLCGQRNGAPADADVWHLRHHWRAHQETLLVQLLQGDYRLSPMQVVGQGANSLAIWGARDALVLKWVALQIAPLLPLHARCEHVKGHGGGKASIERLSAILQQGTYPWVCRTDVKGYYANIDQDRLLAQVNAHVIPPVLRNLVHQYVRYTVEEGGTFHTPARGISRGCALSPLMGALYLADMDDHFAAREVRPGQANEVRNGIVYARYMDDIVILARSRWQLKKQVRSLNRHLDDKGLRQHPDKTFIGKTMKGFDWMGAWLTPAGVTDVAPRAKANHRERVRRLYERAWRRREPKGIATARVSAYRKRWTIWALALGCASCVTNAATLTAVVRAGTGGIIGYTNYVSGHVDGTSTYGPPYGNSPAYAGSAIGLQGSDCDGAINNDYAFGPTTGVRGIRLSGTTAVLLTDGTGQWTRTNDAGVKYHGHVVYHLGAWSNQWTPEADGITSLNSTPDGTFEGYVLCPSTTSSEGFGHSWSLSIPRSSDATVRFAIDAPAGGLQPGTYLVPRTIYLADHASRTGSLSQPLADSVDVVVAQYSCSLSMPATVPLTSASPTATITANAHCTDGPTHSSGPMAVWLNAEAAGTSAAVTTVPAALGVADSEGKLTVRGSWNWIAPTCSSSDMYFDGRNGLSLGTISPGGTLYPGPKSVSFRLCDTGATPGSYSAQATFSIVGR